MPQAATTPTDPRLDQLTELENAIAIGATRVAYENKTVEYRSLDDMLRIRSMLRRELGLDSGASATVLVSHDRGFPPVVSPGDVISGS